MIFYQEAYHVGLGALFNSYAGYFHTIQRLVAACVVHLPLARAPFLFNAAAFVVQFLPVLLIVSPRTDSLFSNPQDKYVFAFLYLACPLNIDTYVTLTNIQWYLPVWILFYLLADRASSRAGRWVEYLLLGLACLTGPFVFFLLPLYGLLLYRKKARFDPVHGVILFTGFVIQLLAVLHTSNPTPASHNLPLLAKVFSVKIFWNSLFGAKGQQYLLGNAVYYANAWFQFSGFGLWLLTTFLAYRTRDVVLIAFTAFALLVALSGFYRGLHDFESWGVNPVDGGRYANNAVLALLYAYYVIYRQAQRSGGYGRYLFGLFFGLGCLVAIPFDFTITRMVDLRWQDQVPQYALAKPGQEVVLPINPPGWKLTLVKRSTGNAPGKLRIKKFVGILPSAEGYSAMLANSTLSSRDYPLQQGKYVLTVHAHSTAVDSTYGYVKVFVNEQLAGGYFVDENAREKRLPFQLDNNSSCTFRIVFENDAITATQDRNVFVKLLEVERLD